MAIRDLSIKVNLRNLEPEALDIFKKAINLLDVSHFFDVGTNVGIYSWNAISTNKNLTVYIFEPDETNIKLLKKTIKQNNLSNIILFEGVVSNNTDNVDFFVDEASGATGSLINHSSNQDSLHHAYGIGLTKKVRAVTLDNYLGEIDNSHRNILIKIDVEGAEEKVLEGALNFIDHYRPIIFIECFQINNLDSINGKKYNKFQMDNKGNFLLIPNEKFNLLDETFKSELFKSQSA